MDKAAPLVIDGNISVGRHNDEMVIVFENKVKPSMIKGLHETKTCFNGEHIVASACDCKSGCKVDSSLIASHNKKLCTHGLSLIVSLHAFLHDGLGTHVLVELRMRMNDELDCTTCDAAQNRSNILTLMSACGSQRSSTTHCGCPLLECLEEFTVGTDLMKRSRKARVGKSHSSLRDFRVVKAEHELKI